MCEEWVFKKCEEEGPVDICEEEAFNALRWREWLRALFQEESVGKAKLYCGKESLCT